MTGKTHIAGGIFAGTVILKAATLGQLGFNPVSVPEACLVIGCAVLGALTPDLDITTSKIGHSLGPLSKLANMVFGHRTMFHGLMLYVIICFGLSRTIPGASLYLYAFFAGSISHLILDYFNPAGIPLFWPLQTRFWAVGIKSGGIVDHFFFF